MPPATPPTRKPRPPEAYSRGKLRLGTRGSPLALWQAQTTQALLTAQHPDLEVELVVIKTSGDRDQSTPLDNLPHTGYFTKELEAALCADRIDLAVHSLKDMAAQTAEPFVLGAILPRGPARDALVLHPRYSRLTDLPEEPVILTGSVRRARQLPGLFPRCLTRPVRGNIHTRIGKVASEGADALVIAEAALERLNVTGHPVVTLSIEKMVPAPGQGAIALEILAERSDLREHLAPLESETTRRATDMERQLAYLLEGGCTLPLGAHAYPNGDGLTFRTVFCPDGQAQPRFEQLRVPHDADPTQAAETMANRFRQFV